MKLRLGEKEGELNLRNLALLRKFTEKSLKTDTGKLNAVRAQKEVSCLLCRNDVNIIPRNNLLMVLAKDNNDN